jgi:predicted aminopeptidase
LLLCLALPGCYLAHLTNGQVRILWARRPIPEVLVDPTLSEDERTRLQRVLEVRAFAETLGLEVDGSYRHYVAWPGDRIVTSVVATRPREIEPAGFWFPIVGRVPYKGYFDPALANDQALALRADGLDVCEVSVRAYSTLGWFDDPVTGPMLRQPEGDLVETLLHELVHATAFVSSQPEFNEGVASFIGQEARVRFYAEQEGDTEAASQRERVGLRRQIRSEMLVLRDDIAALYASDASGGEIAAQRAALEAATRTRIATLPFENGRAETYADQVRLNDACLALTATYGGDAHCYEAALEDRGGALESLVAALRDAAETDDPRAALFGTCATLDSVETGPPDPVPE